MTLPKGWFQRYACYKLRRINRPIHKNADYMRERLLHCHLCTRCEITYLGSHLSHPIQGIFHIHHPRSIPSATNFSPLNTAGSLGSWHVFNNRSRPILHVAIDLSGPHCLWQWETFGIHRASPHFKINRGRIFLSIPITAVDLHNCYPSFMIWNRRFYTCMYGLWNWLRL